MSENEGPSPDFIASQLRKPSGDFAEKIGLGMNQANEFLHDFVLSCMEIRDNDKILEIGFGNGKFLDKIYVKANGLMVAGIDYSNEMVESAKSNNTEAISAGKLEVQTASSDSIPYPDDTFNVVFCNMVIFFWEEPAEHLREISRVLKPGGKFYTGIRTKSSMEQFSFTKHGFKLYENDEWRNILESNGFRVDQVLTKPGQKISEGGRTFDLESVCFIAEKTK